MYRWLFGIILGLAVLAGLWRFVDMSRDPDIVTESSQDSWGDPAQYLYNARSHVLFGDWRVSEGVTMYAAPGYTFLASLCLTLFGVSFGATVMMATLAGFVVIAATAAFASTVARMDRKIPPWHAAAAAAAMLLLSYIMFAHQHVPNGDMEALAASSLAALGLALLQSVDPEPGRLRFRGLAVLSGMAVGLAPFIKLHNGIFTIAALAAWVISYPALDDDWRGRWRAASPWLALGLAMAAAIWIGWALWIYRLGSAGDLAGQMDRLRIFSVLTARPQDKDFNPKGAFSLFRYLQSNLMYRQPVEMFLGTLGFFSVFTGRRRNWPRLFAAIWFLTGVLVMTSITPDPLRYRLIVWPAVVILAADFWTTLANGMGRRLDMRMDWPAVLGLGVVFGSIAAYLASVRLHWSNSLLLQLALIIVATAAAYFGAGLMRQLSPLKAAAILALLLVTFSVSQWVAGERQVSHELNEAAQRLDKYPAGYVLGGGWGVRLGFSSRRNAYFFWTPEAAQRVNLFVEDPVYLKDIPLPWHEVERHSMKRLPLSMAFVQIDR